MTTENNLVAWCMDSLRWDTFQLADTPHFDAFTEFRRAYSRAGVTIPSLFASFMNLPWYEAKGDNLAPRLKKWWWVPQQFADLGFYNVFITGNPMLKRYGDVFGRYFDEYVDVSGGYQAHVIINRVKEIFESVDKPKFVFMLFMETHYPYQYVRDDKEKYDGVSHRSITCQMKAVEALDREFHRLTKVLPKNENDVVVFSDHGELFIDIEGEYGHGHGRFHPKLFEIPLGRATI